MSWTAATIYHLGTSIEHEQVEEFKQWTYPEPGDLGHIGIVPIDDYNAQSLGNSGLFFRMLISERKCSASDIKLQVSERANAYEKKTGAPMSKKEKAAIRDEVRTELLNVGPLSHTRVDILIRPDWLMIMHGSANVCDKVTTWLRNQLGGLQVRAPKTKHEFGKAISSMLDTNELKLDNLKLGGTVKAHIDGSVLTIRDAEYTNDLLSVLRDADDIPYAQLDWAADINSKVSSDYTFRSIRCSFDSLDEQDRNDLDTRAEALYYITNLPRMLKDIAAHAGGLVDPGWE